MGAIKEYKIEFPKRTIHLLDSFRLKQVDYNYDVTLMMNCLLGLIVLAVENSDRDNLMPGKVDDGLLSVIPNKIKIKQGKKGLCEIDSHYLKTFYKIAFLKMIRNGIAHQNIKGLNDHGIWAGIKLWNVNKAGSINFEMTLSTEQLYQLATYISKHYLKKLNNKNYGKA